MDLPWFTLTHRNISNYLLQCNFYTILSMSTSLYHRGGCQCSTTHVGGEGSGEGHPDSLSSCHGGHWCGCCCTFKVEWWSNHHCGHFEVIGAGWVMEGQFQYYAVQQLRRHGQSAVTEKSQKSHRKVTDSHGCQMQTPLGTTMRLHNYKLYWLYCTR